MASSNRFVRWILALITLCTVLVTGTSLTAAQCAVRSDWAVYIVQPGDTLGKLALRYATPIPTLAAGNCLTNINLIYAGQQLRVPSGLGGNLPPPSGPVYPSQLAASYQPFEHGIMTWKAATGEIGVYYAPSGVIANGGVVRIFLPVNYSNLPNNPYIVPTPSGLFLPAFGFGKVWGNYSDIRAALGFATAGETGYLMQVFPPNSVTYQFTIPDGRTISVNSNQVWSFSSSIPVVVPPAPPVPVVTTTSTSYQPFQAGFMIWESHTGNVVAFYNNSQYQVFTARSYSSLPDNPVLDPVPAGLVRPAFGIGKVWGNFPAVRQMIGWATQGESYYAPSFRSSSPSGFPQTCFVLPDGRIVTYFIQNGRALWNFSASCS